MHPMCSSCGSSSKTNWVWRFARHKTVFFWRFLHFSPVHACLTVGFAHDPCLHDGCPRAVHPARLSLSSSHRLWPQDFITCQQLQQLQGEDPDEINRLDAMIAEGAFGSVYRVCDPPFSLHPPSTPHAHIRSHTTTGLLHAHGRHGGHQDHPAAGGRVL